MVDTGPLDWIVILKVLLGNPLHLDVSVAMLHAEHLEVALVEESALHLVYGLEGDWDLGKLQVVAALTLLPDLFLRWYKH